MGSTLVQPLSQCYATFTTSALGDEELDSSKTGSLGVVTAASGEASLHMVGCGFTVELFLVLGLGSVPLCLIFFLKMQ